MFKEGRKMVDIKEIKSIKLVPFTKMSASVHAIMAFIVALVFLITLIIMKTTGFMHDWGMFKLMAGMGIAMIVIYPIAAFFMAMAVSFFSVMIYNALSSGVGGVKLGMDGNEVSKIPIISFSLILACIEAIWAFIAGIVLAAMMAPITVLLSEAVTQMPNLMNTTSTSLPNAAAMGLGGSVVALLLIFGLPLMVFICGFIGNALFAIFYNYLVTRVSKIKLEFAQVAEKTYQLKSIPVLPTALAVALVFTIFGLISGLSFHLEILLWGVVGNFIEYFIGTALVALIYNFLAPRIGEIEVGVE